MSVAVYFLQSMTFHFFGKIRIRSPLRIKSLFLIDNEKAKIFIKSLHEFNNVNRATLSKFKLRTESNIRYLDII